jgi:2,3-bisphosphoglycerate-dependent phosphoglycerate mutase
MALNRENYLFDRDVDPDLTPDGKKQAELAADYLASPYRNNGFDPQNREGFGLTHLYCSLMIRAVKTGQTISNKTGLPLVAMPEVHETGGMFYAERGDEEPVFIGQPGPGRSYFKSEFPDLVLPEDLPEEGWWGREKEPREEYLDRAQSVIDRLVKDHSGKGHRVGVVMHGGIFARILTVLFNIQTPKYWFLMNNCGISRVEISDDGRPMLTYMNKVDFLPDHLVT